MQVEALNLIEAGLRPRRLELSIIFPEHSEYFVAYACEVVVCTLGMIGHWRTRWQEPASRSLCASVDTATERIGIQSAALGMGVYMSSSGVDWESILCLAITLAHDAGAELRRRFGRQIVVTFKDELNPVTDVDQAAETLIRQGIHTHFPSHAIQGEEQGETRSEGAFRWIVDPLDGTANYAHTFPHFAVSIAVADAYGVHVGVVYDPMRNELFTAQRGQPAWLNGRRLSVSHTTELQQALLATGFPYDRRRNTDNNHREFVALNLASQGVRRAGSAALDLAYVASGRLDGYWEQRLGPWDVAAGALLVACAGGTLSTYDGRPFDGLGHQIVASNGHLHAALLAELARTRQ